MRLMLFNIVLIALSLCVAVVLAEVGVRLAAPQQLILIRPDLWEPADTIGWTRRPDVDARVNTGEGTVRLITDSYGFRIGAEGRRDGIPVLLLGDSFMEALQVNYEESLSGLLDVSLSDELGAPVAVRNAGIGGWSPGQYLSRARSLVPNGEFQLVIVAVYVGNDAQPMRVQYLPPRKQVVRHEFRLPRGLSRAAFVDATLRPLNDFLEQRSHLYILLRTQLRTLRMRTGTSSVYFPPEFLKSEAGAARWSLTGDICSDIRDVAAAHGAETLFVLIPADFQVEPNNFNDYVRGFGIDTSTVDLDQPSRLLRTELEARGLHVLDPLPDFRERTQSGMALYGDIDQHLSGAGHRVLAELVTPAAAALLAERVAPATAALLSDQ